MTDPEQMTTYTLESSRNPTRLGLYEDQEILEKGPVTRLTKEVIIDNTRPRPLSPVYSDMSLELAKQFNAALGGDMSPEQAVGKLQSDLGRIAEEGQKISSGAERGTERGAREDRVVPRRKHGGSRLVPGRSAGTWKRRQ